MTLLLLLQNSEVITGVSYTIDPSQISLNIEILEPIVSRDIIPIYDYVSSLRLDDIAFNLFIQDKLVENEFENVQVVDGFPDETLVIPCISVEHDLTMEYPIGLDKNRSIRRQYIVDIFAPTKGYRDELVSFIQSLDELSMDTIDNRRNYIESIDLIDTKDSIYRGVPSVKRYYYVAFNGQSTYGIVDDLGLGAGDQTLVIDMDINIKSQTIVDPIKIYDRYDEATNRGIKLEIRSNNGLYVVAGLESTSVEYQIPFATYFDTRIRLTVAVDFSETRLVFAIFIDGTRVLLQTAFWFFAVANATNIPYVIGCSNSLEDGFCKMDLYGLRLEYDSALLPNKYVVPSKIGEYLGRSDNDLAFYHLNEGRNEIAYHKRESLAEDKHNLTLYNDYMWILYLEEKIDDSKYRHAMFSIVINGVNPV